MAEYYSRREMGLLDERIRDDEHLYVNAEEFQTLSRSDDHGLVERDLGTLSRFQWDYLFDGSRGGSGSNSVNEDIQSNEFASRSRNYDRAVERSVPIVSEGIRNVTAYDPNVDGSRYIGRIRNVARVLVEDDRNYSVREREYSQRQYVDEVNGHIGRTRNVARVPIEDDGNYSVREREYPQRQSVDEVKGHIARTRNVARVPVEDDGNYSVREREYPQRQSVDEVNGHIALTRNVARVPVEDDGNYSVREREYPQRQSVDEVNGHIGRTRNVARVPVEDDGNYSVREREYPQRQSVDDVNGHIGRTRNVARVPVEDDGNYSVREREYPQRQSVDEVNGHIGRTRNVIRLPVEDGRNYLVREKEYPQRQSYDEENGLLFRSEDGSHSLTPRSQSSGQRTPSRGISRESLPQEGQYHSVDGIGSSSRIQPTRLSSYYRIRSAEGVSPRPRGEYAPNVHSSDVYVHPESHRPRDYSLAAVSKDQYDAGHLVQGYNDRGSYGIDVVDATLPRDHYVGNSRRDAVMEEGYSGLHDINHPLQEAPAFDNYDVGPRNSYPDHRTEEIRQSLSREEQFTYERHTRDMSYEQHGYGVRRNEEIPTMLENSQRIMDVGDFSSLEQPNTLKRRLVSANETSETSGAKRLAYADRGASSYDERHLSAEDEDGLRLSNRVSHRHGESHSRAHTGVSIAEARQPSSGLRKSCPKPLSKSDECSRGDVMKRLGKAKSRPKPLSKSDECSRGDVMKRLGKAKGTDFKKKLKSVPNPVAYPSTAPDPVVLNSEPNINKQQKRAIKDSGSMNDDDLRSQVVDADQPVLKVKPLNDEDPVKFKQNVDEWFFKCMVHLYKNINYQKKFKGQGIGCRLKCVICSSLKEFCATKDVAAHAFSSLKIGYKAQHLGFHRALCVLMGWDTAVAANDRWVCRSLPEPVAWTLREDVIIWPPVVIIQNFQARNCQLNEIGKLSIELKNILNDKGFDKEIKAVHEKPGNPNFMVVEFIGTAPGLKEAERLHNSFAENNYGRAELAQLDAEVVYCKVADKKPEDTRKLVDKSEDYQYSVDKKEDDQELLDRIKDEQSVVKTDDYQMPIDKREDENEHMKIDPQLVDKADDDQEPIDKDRDDLSSVDKARNDQVLVDEAQGEQKPVDNSLGDQELLKETQGEQKAVNNSLGDQELVKEAQGEQIPVDKSKGDQEQANKTSDTRGLTDNRKDDQEPLDKTGYDQEPVGLADNSKDDQELVEEAQGEQIHVDKSKGDQEQANKTSDTQGLTDNRKDDQGPFDKTGYDQEPVELADNRKDNQELFDKTTYDQEPAGQKGDDQEPVGKKYNTLYGYLGIIEDLHRLPNEMKHHHIARSKKEIFASYNALI
ncbi:uncharacterized protein LOC141622798 [Silene latifolia]|uniref:uncharacterized protein LOC141622798 n=1 Tax=Silene latifolia TaxID=37657 RepID=UPI003D777002